MTTVSTWAKAPTWEQSLLTLADEAHRPAQTAEQRAITAGQKTLARAYEYCERLTAVHSRSFYLSSSLLPEGKRRAMRALYAFCRMSDDIVDSPDEDRAGRLRAWKARALSPNPPAEDRVALAWADARARYGIPVRYAEQLLEGVGRDLAQCRYETFEDLAAYAYGVASTVGLMSMYITGFKGEDAIPYAIKLGVALQVTNILRDVGEDWRAGRVYLPAGELATFGLGETDLARGRVTDSWRAFMAYQIERNRRLYEESWPGIGLLQRDGRLAVAAAATFYQGILTDIEAHDYDVFSRRAHVSGWGKARLVPGMIWRTARLGEGM
jgi:phytoene synthase